MMNEYRFDEVKYNRVVSAILEGRKFKYKSYDHKKAIEELKTTNKYYVHNKILGSYNKANFHSYEIPNELKEKYVVWRVGKIRDIHFNPKGEMCMFRIGNKRAKTFYLYDFDVNVFII